MLKFDPSERISMEALAKELIILYPLDDYKDVLKQVLTQYHIPLSVPFYAEELKFYSDIVNINQVDTKSSSSLPAIDDGIQRLSITASLPFHHGVMTALDLTPMLKSTGDFLLYNPARDRNELMIAVRRKGWPDYYPVSKNNNLVYIRLDNQFRSLGDLIKYYSTNKLPGNNHNKLKTGITKAYWELSENSIRCGDRFKDGFFGDCYRGSLKLSESEIRAYVLKLTSYTPGKFETVMTEVRSLLNIHHPNTMKIYGVCSAVDPIMIVKEWMSDGKLRDYLNRNTLTNIQKKKFCAQACYGLKVLHENGITHGYICSQNVYLNEGAVKLSMPINTMSSNHDYEPQIIPLRWQTPQSFRSGDFTTLSDVYQMGLLFYEILTNGKLPYPGMIDAQISQELANGRCMVLDESFSVDSKRILNACWAPPETRWTSAEAAVELQTFSGLEMPPL